MGDGRVMLRESPGVTQRKVVCLCAADKKLHEKGTNIIEHVYERIWNIFLIPQISQTQNDTSLNRYCPG
jgi:hypothetical protein